MLIRVYRWPINVQLRWRMMSSIRRSVSAARQVQARMRAFLVSCGLSHNSSRILIFKFVPRSTIKQFCHNLAYWLISFFSWPNIKGQERRRSSKPSECHWSFRWWWSRCDQAYHCYEATASCSRSVPISTFRRRLRLYHRPSAQPYLPVPAPQGSPLRGINTT